MGKQKKATLHDASGKKILHPAEAERKKFKQRARENRAKNRKKNYETKMLQKAPELIEAEINDFQEMEKKGKLTKWKKDKMTREIAFYGRLKNQVEQNNSKRMEDQAGDQFFVDFEELKIHRKASIYYDPVKNPYGAPPSGQVLMYRHPDGSVKREPPELPSGVSSAQLTQGLVPGHGDMVLPHQRPMQEEEDDGESEESEDDDDEEDDEPMLPSELPDGTPLPASSSSPPPGPPEPPGPPGLPPLPPGPPPLTSLPPMPPGPPPGCGGGVGRGPPMMPKLPCFGGGAPQSQADFAKQMMNIGFMPVPPPVVPEVMGVSGPVPKRPVQVKSSLAIPCCHLRQLNPHLDQTGFNAVFNSELNYYNYSQGIVHVSSFGFGGTNAHAIFWGEDVYHAPSNAELFQKRLRQMSPPEVRINGSDPALWDWDGPDTLILQGDKYSIEMNPDEPANAPQRWFKEDTGGEPDDGEEDFYCISGAFNDFAYESMEDGPVTGLRTITVKVPASGQVEFRIFKNWNENGSNQVIYPGADKCTRKLQVIYGPLSEDQAPKNSWLAEGIPNSFLKIDFFCCRGIKSINWMEAPPEAIM